MNTYLSVGSYTFFRTLTGGNGNMSKGIISDTLKADVFDFTIMVNTPEYGPLEDTNGVALYDTNNNALYALGENITINEADFFHGQRVHEYRADGTYIRRFYVDYIERTGKYSYILHCMSIIGLLAEMQHYGNMYSSEFLYDVLHDILGGTLITEHVNIPGVGMVTYKTIELDYIDGTPKARLTPDVYNVLVSGWLPIASRRDNLMQLLFATGLSLIDNGSELSITFQQATSARDIPPEQIYIGGTVPASDNVTDVSLTEHTFIKDTTLTPVTLYDTTVNVTSQLITFSEPCHTLVATAAPGATFTKDEEGCNYCIVSGTGTLTGIPYVHTTIELTDTTGKTGTKKEVTVKDMTLVSALNSHNTLLRLKNYYATAEIVKASFVTNWYNNPIGTSIDRAGHFYTFTHPYTGAEVLGCLKEADLNFSEIVKADSQFVINWVPLYVGNNFNNQQTFTSAGSFTVPADCTLIRIILISGATGGHGGYNGQAATNDRANLSGGSGGAGALGGASGRTLIQDLTVTPGDTFAITVGTGGAGGAAEQAGTEGTASTFGSYSSASGALITDNLVINPITGDVYGGQGIAGQDGADGGGYPGESPYRGGSFENIYSPYTIYQGGAGVKPSSYESYWWWGTVPQSGPDLVVRYTGTTTVTQAQGGGAAYGAVGGGGVGGHVYITNNTFNGVKYPQVTSAIGPNGGAGANALVNTTQVPRRGQGGNGGNGGGGGGKQGFAVYSGTECVPSLDDGFAGVGGAGSAGGAGGDGVVIVLF